MKTIKNVWNWIKTTIASLWKENDEFGINDCAQRSCPVVVEEDPTPVFNYDEELKKLKENGWKVRMEHQRYFPHLECIDEYPYMTRYEFTQLPDSKLLAMFEKGKYPPNCEFKYKDFVSNNGGMTVISITSPSGETYTAKSVCSNDDFFSRKVGRSIALERCLKLVPQN